MRIRAIWGHLLNSFYQSELFFCYFSRIYAFYQPRKFDGFCVASSDISPYRNSVFKFLDEINAVQIVDLI